MKKFKEAIFPSGRIIKDFAVVENEDGTTLTFSKEKRPDLWKEYQESLKPEKPKKKKKKAE